MRGGIIVVVVVVVGAIAGAAPAAFAGDVKTVTVEGIAVVGDGRDAVAAADAEARARALNSAIEIVHPQVLRSPAPPPTIWEFFPRLTDELVTAHPEVVAQPVFGPAQDGPPGTRKVKLTARVDLDEVQRLGCELLRTQHNTAVVVVVAETEIGAPKVLVGEMEARLTHGLQDACFRTLSSPVDVTRIDGAALPEETIDAIHAGEPGARWLIVAAVHSDVKEKVDSAVSGMTKYRVRTALRAIDLGSGAVDHDQRYQHDVIGISIEKAMDASGDRVTGPIFGGLLPDLGRRFADDPLPPAPPPPPPTTTTTKKKPSKKK